MTDQAIGIVTGAVAMVVLSIAVLVFVYKMSRH